MDQLTEMTRYIRRLSDRDLALDRAMIPLGSCTMKLNATAEMLPITWPEFSDIHPFVPADQALGYKEMIDETWMVLPIVDWTARDVFALAVARGLPISEHYRKLLEKFLISPESPASRVDCVLTEDKIVARGAMVHLRVLYPNLWSRLVSLRPELMKET